MTNSFTAQFQRALDCYSEKDFATFFDMAEIHDPTMQMIGKDILGIAGAHYFTQMDQLSATQTRTETLKHLKRAQRASRDLAESLRLVMKERDASTALMEAGVSAGRDLARDQIGNHDTLNILNAIFPIAVDGKGFREEGLQKALRVIADCLQEVEAEAIPKARRGRSHAIAPWLNVVVAYWIEATRSIPTAGHYYSETGDYASQSFAALTFAAEKLDREISSSLLASALQPALDTLENDPLVSFVTLSPAIVEIVGAGVSVSDDAALAGWLGAPVEAIRALASKGPSDQGEVREQAVVSKEEFFEAMKSSEPGKMLLQGLMDLDRG